jgi:hypothetical protein
MAAFCLRLLAYRLKPRPLSNGVLFERQNKTIIIIIICDTEKDCKTCLTTDDARSTSHGKRCEDPSLRATLIAQKEQEKKEQEKKEHDEQEKKSLTVQLARAQLTPPSISTTVSSNSSRRLFLERLPCFACGRM